MNEIESETASKVVSMENRYVLDISDSPSEISHLMSRLNLILNLRTENRYFWGKFLL